MFNSKYLQNPETYYTTRRQQGLMTFSKGQGSAQNTLLNCTIIVYKVPQNKSFIKLPLTSKKTWLYFLGEETVQHSHVLRICSSWQDSVNEYFRWCDLDHDLWPTTRSYNWHCYNCSGSRYKAQLDFLLSSLKGVQSLWGFFMSMEWNLLHLACVYLYIRLSGKL